MDFDYISRARTQEIEREIAQIRLASAAKRAQHRTGAVPEPRTVSSVPLRLLRRACQQVGAMRSAS